SLLLAAASFNARSATHPRRDNSSVACWRTLNWGSPSCAISFCNCSGGTGAGVRLEASEAHVGPVKHKEPTIHPHNGLMVFAPAIFPSGRPLESRFESDG